MLEIIALYDITSVFSRSYMTLMTIISLYNPSSRYNMQTQSDLCTMTIQDDYKSRLTHYDDSGPPPPLRPANHPFPVMDVIVSFVPLLFSRRQWDILFIPIKDEMQISISALFSLSPAQSKYLNPTPHTTQTQPHPTQLIFDCN